jgi:bifunctional non-homologous end joining protein LigD
MEANVSTTSAIEESCSLYYKDGASDKVYHCQLEHKGKGYVVNFQYGRRGNSLQTGSKTTSPVTLDKAKKIFDKLVADKKSKGYSEGAEGTPYQGSSEVGTVSGMVPQLLNFITEEKALELLGDENWIMQEKVDGVRCMIERNNGVVTASNRRGLVIDLPQTIVDDLLSIGFKQDAAMVLDGERIGDEFHVFDVTTFLGESLVEEPYSVRLQILESGILDDEYDHLCLVQTARTEREKRILWDLLKKNNAEGIVFTEKNSKYVPGRPNSGGNRLKYKFYATATCTVDKINDKRSVGILVRSETANSRGSVPVGNVTIPVNHDIPQVGAKIEVRYLYAYPNGSLFQPTYLGVREDKTVADRYNTLKFKQGTEEDEEV